MSTATPTIIGAVAAGAQGQDDGTLRAAKPAATWAGVLDGQLTKLRHALMVVSACSLFMVTGPTLILENKRIMQELVFPYPMALSALGVITSAVGTRLGVSLGLLSVRKQCTDMWLTTEWFRSVLPVSICTAATMGFGNALYLHLGVGFAQMLKAFTPVVVLAVLVALKLEVPTFPVISSVVLITLGTMVTTAEEPNWNAIGLAFNLAATVSEALRVALTESLLREKKLSVVEGQYVLAPISSAILILMAAVCELPAALAADARTVILDHPQAFAGAALMGAALNYLSYFVIQTTGAMTLKVITTLRNIALIIYGALLLGEVISAKQGMGYGIALIGFMGYTHFSARNETERSRQREVQKQTS